MPAKRYYARRYYNRKRKWTRCQQKYIRNCPVVPSQQFSSYSYPIIYTNSNVSSSGIAAPAGSTRLKVKNIKVQCNLFDSNAGEFWLLSLVYMPNAANEAATLDNITMDNLASREYTFLNPNCVMAQKKVTVNDYDTSNVTLYTRLARWIDPGSSIRLVITHGSESAANGTNAGVVSFWSSYYVTDS